MRILVTGANGQVGRSLVRLLDRTTWEWAAVERRSLDISESVAVTDYLSCFRPDVVINAAAYTAVDKAESEPKLAELANFIGPSVLAKACRDIGCHLIHLSTDYVFSGTSNRRYVESDPVAPINIYGQTKLNGENAIRKILQQHVIIRTSWVYSEYGQNFVKTMLRLAKEKTELSIVNDQLGCPTFAGDIALALLVVAEELIVNNNTSFGTYHLAGEELLSWLEFAKKIFIASENLGVIDRTPRVLEVSSDDYRTIARRPKYSGLDSSLIQKTFSLVSFKLNESLNTCLSGLIEK